eukprot:237950_1
MSTEDLRSVAASISSQLDVNLDMISNQSEEKHSQLEETKGNFVAVGVNIDKLANDMDDVLNDRRVDDAHSGIQGSAIDIVDYSDSEELKEENRVVKPLVKQVVKPDNQLISYVYSDDEDECMFVDWLNCGNCGAESKPEVCINTGNLRVRCPVCKVKVQSFVEAENRYYKRRKEIEKKMNSDMEAVLVKYTDLGIDSAILALQLQLEDLKCLRKAKDDKLLRIGKVGNLSIDRALNVECSMAWSAKNNPFVRLCGNEFCMVHHGKKDIVNQGKKGEKFTGFDLNDPDRFLGFLHDYSKINGYGWLREINSREEIHAHVKDSMDFDFVNSAICVAHPNKGWVDIILERGRPIYHL